MLEKDNKAIAQAGFSATARDYVRIALHLIRELNDKNDFLTQATTPQISIGKKNANFRSYGFQIWTENHYSKNSFWLSGMNGQRIGIDADKEKIIFISSYKDYDVTEIYKLFDQFQNLTI